VAVDGNGNVVLTGSFFIGVDPNTFNSLSEYYTAKYAAADGTLLWEQRYHGPANYDDQARAVAVDGSDNVVVTGGSGNGAPNYDHDYYTARYAANGALLWEKRYHGPANADDFAQAVAVDGSGNVVVTGNSFNGNGNADYYTAKYAAADGALLWEKRYNGPGNGNDIVGYSRSLALGPNGVVAVTGSSYGDSGADSPDFATVAYRENQPPVITCPANKVADFSSGDGAVVNFTVSATGDSGVPPAITCAPPSGSVFPIGQTTVTCTATDADSLSSTCSFTVTVLGARGVKENVLAELIALRATVRERDDGRKLAETIEHLTQSLAAELWVDQTHLKRQHGEQVFREDKEAIKQLCDLLKSKKSRIPDAVLQEFVDRIFRADRLLVAVAIQDAITAGESKKKIEQARKFLAEGDAEACDDKCANGIEDYRNAWLLAIHS
jgi:hypothetical protein